MANGHDPRRNAKSHRQHFTPTRVIAIFLTVIALSCTSAAASVEASGFVAGGKRGIVLWFLTDIVGEIFEDWLESNDDEGKGEQTDNEAREDQPFDAESDVIAEYFQIPANEYRRWPERWKRVLREVHTAPENFSKRTIHTLKLLDTSDWLLLEKMAAHALGGHLLAEGFFEARLIGIEADDQVELEAMGVVNSGGARLQLVLKPQSDTELYRSYLMGRYGLILWFRDHAHEAPRTAARITRTGRELVHLLEPRPTEKHLRQLAASFAEEGIRTEYWRVDEIPGTNKFSLDEKIWQVLPEQ